MIGQHFLSKFLKDPAKKFILGNIAVGQEQPETLMKNSFVGIFHNRKFCCISQRTEAVIVKVKHKFHFKSKACVH